MRDLYDVSHPVGLHVPLDALYGLGRDVVGHDLGEALNLLGVADGAQPGGGERLQHLDALGEVPVVEELLLDQELDDGDAQVAVELLHWTRRDKNQDFR